MRVSRLRHRWHEFADWQICRRIGHRWDRGGISDFCMRCWRTEPHFETKVKVAADG
jgi:hypothetical protein